MADEIVELTVKELLGGKQRYVIPMYQRNYSWDEGEITQLLQDILDYVPEGKNYYIGTLVVFQREDKAHALETIDGQQRLTTLSLLVSYLKKHKEYGDFSWFASPVLEFDSRPRAGKTFSAIHGSTADNDMTAQLSESELNAGILHGYRLISEILPKKLRELQMAGNSQLTPAKFAEFLISKVILMQVRVPHDTDLNHYFEIMNSRGEQLEKHEVLKAQLMAPFKQDKLSLKCIHLIWEACANMEKYVQLGFEKALRDAVFGKDDWGDLTAADFDSIREQIIKLAGPEAGLNVQQDPAGESLSEILSKPAAEIKNSSPDKEGAPERFNSVVNFQNFLLHVLRVQTGNDIPLDDKKLISVFKEHILDQADAQARVKLFIYNLLKCKYLFDKYVLKREFVQGDERWALKRMKRNKEGSAQYVNTFGPEESAEGENRRLLMLLAAFHVSTPTMVYKHWLNGVLNYLFQESGQISASAYLEYLEGLGKAFLFDRFLCDKPLDYYEIIFRNLGRLQANNSPADDDRASFRKNLEFGNLQNNLIFNFLDYLLWVRNEENAHVAIISDFKFTFRSSVEHFYPQEPKPGYARLDPQHLHSFGNLCLISHSKNSTLSNFMPKAKQDYYENNTIDSIKQYLMMQKMKKKDKWDAEEIEAHYLEMENVLMESLAYRAYN